MLFGKIRIKIEQDGILLQDAIFNKIEDADNGWKIIKKKLN